MKKWTIAIVVILLIAGVLYFTIGRSSDDQDLGDNYYYLPKYEAIDIGYSEGAIIYKSTQKKLFSNIKIHGDVISINANEDYIIAIQQEVDSTSLETADVKKGSLKYFIIQKKSDLVFGPYSKEEYLSKREELGIPHEFSLKQKE